MEPISIDIASLNLQSLAPMLITIFGALTILVIDLASKKELDKSFYTMFTILVLLVDLGAVVGYNGNTRGFFDVMLLDGIAILSQIIILVASALFIVLAISKRNIFEYKYPEYFALFLFMIAGFQFMVASDNLILIFVGLETASLALYVMIAMHNRDKSFEAAIKYFTMGALAAGFFAFGAMILYALTGSVELHQISTVLAERDFEPFLYTLLAIVFMIAALGFKLSMVPFHIWTPDVYEGSSSALAGYMSIVPKIAGFVVALRFFDIFVSSNVVWVENVLYLIVVVTMTLPNMMALVQTDVKRMLAYSSISHAGFVMAAILIGTTQATSSIFLYWILFVFTNFGAFAMLWINRHKNKETGEFDNPFEKFSGMIHISPLAATMMALFMLSLAGVPPFSLFWGKMYLMSATINAGFIILALIMAVNSAISAYYYLKLIVYMFLKPSKDNDGTKYITNASLPLQTVLGISVMVTIFSIFFIDSLLAIIVNYVQVSGF
jgi:NADH-quinone oxidoreductase subunit N